MATEATGNVSPFIAQFPISSRGFAATLSPHIGQMYPRHKFTPPTGTTKTNIKAFLQTLTAYDAAPSADLEAKLNSLMNSLNLSAIRLQEDPNNSVIFYPNDIKGNTPITCGAVLTWRFGQTAQFNVAGGIPQVFVFDPHSGQDGTIQIVTQQYLAGGAKGLLSNAFNPNVANNHNFKGNPITANNIRRFADPAHSNTTAFMPFVIGLYEIFPHAGCTVTHGMAGKANFQMIANNDRVAKFLENGKRDWCALLSIALALQSLPTEPNIAVICAPLPGYIIKNGVKVPLISAKNRKAPLRLNKHVGDNTDGVGHMANLATNPFAMGQYLDNAFFVEFGEHARKANSHFASQFVAAQAMAAEWYMSYDPAVQDPWMLAQRFPDVYNDMSLYPKLFDPAFVQEYKTNGTNPYNNSSSGAAIADYNAAVAANAELTGDTDDIADNLTNGVGAEIAVPSNDDAVAAVAAATTTIMQKLLFSSTIAKATVACEANKPCAALKMRIQ